MKHDLTVLDAKDVTPSSVDFDLGTWLGRRQAFGTIAGRCSAAEAECLRQIRDGKIYKSRASSWEEFCVTHVGTSKTQVNRVIRQLEEFGPAYFQLTQLTRIPVEAYRSIAPQVDADGVKFDGEVIAILPENSEKIAAAVTELRKRAAPDPAAEAAPVERFDLLLKRCEELAASLESQKFNTLDDRRKVALLGTLLKLRNSAARIGVTLYPL